MTQTQDEQEAANGHYRAECPSRWWQRGAGGGAGGVVGVDRTNNGGDNMEAVGQEAMEGERASISEEGIGYGPGARQGV